MDDMILLEAELRYNIPTAVIGVENVVRTLDKLLSKSNFEIVDKVVFARRYLWRVEGEHGTEYDISISYGEVTIHYNPSVIQFRDIATKEIGSLRNIIKKASKGEISGKKRSD